MDWDLIREEKGKRKRRWTFCKVLLYGNSTKINFDFYIYLSDIFVFFVKICVYAWNKFSHAVPLGEFLRPAHLSLPRRKWQRLQQHFKRIRKRKKGFSFHSWYRLFPHLSLKKEKGKIYIAVFYPDSGKSPTRRGKREENFPPPDLCRCGEKETWGGKDKYL